MSAPARHAGSRSAVGPLGRLGRWAATHRRSVVLAWVGVALCLGVLAPRAEQALSGGGWQADGSESVEARRLIDRHFDGQGSYALLVVVSSRTHDSESPVFRATVGRVVGLLRREPAVASGAVASARRVDRAERASGDRARWCGRRHSRDGARRESPPRSASGECRTGNRGIAHRLRGPVVGVQRGEQGCDAALRGDVLAGDAGSARHRLRLARRGRDPVGACDPGAGRHRRRALDRSAVHRHHDLGDELRADVRARGGNRLRALRRGSLPCRAPRGPAPG